MSYLSRNGHLARLYIGGYRIPSNQIIGKIDVQREENSAAVMTCQLNPTTGTQDFTQYEGKTAILDIQTSSGITRVFKGKVDLDEYDIINEFIFLRCTDDRKGLAKAFASQVNKIGYFSTDVFGTPENKARELEYRLSTVPQSYDWDGYGNPYLTSWTPKSTPDYTLGNDDIFRRSVRIERTQRARVLNSVQLNIDYTYQRLHHREKRYSWDAGVSVCEFLIDGHTVPRRDLIRDAARAAGWPIKGNISYTSLWPTATYWCTSQSATRTKISWLGPDSNLASAVTYESNVKDVIDGSDTRTTAYDSQGNALVKSAQNLTFNASDYLCRGANWTATTRFSQNVIERYTVTVTAPQSTAQFGTIDKTETFSLNSDFDSGSWEDYSEYTVESGGTNLNDPSGSPTGSYVIDKALNRADFNKAILTLINKAKTSILASHRENRVIFQRKVGSVPTLWPEIDLRHTVRVNFDKIDAKGKVYRIQHSINVSTGEAFTEVELAFYTSTGSASDSAIVAPTPPSYYPVVTDVAMNLGTHYGEDPTQSAAASWTGYVGNRWQTKYKNYYRTEYPEMFIVDTPAIPASFRNTLVMSTSQSYNVSIPNTTFTITYTGSKG